MVFTSNINLITTSTTLSTKDDVYLVNATGGSITIILPNITCDGMQYKFKRIDITSGNSVTIQGFAVGQTIDSNTSIILIPSGICEVQSYGGVWYRVSDGTSGSGGIPIFTTSFVLNNGSPFLTISGTTSTLICSFYYGGSNIKPISAVVFTFKRAQPNGLPQGVIGVYTQAGLAIATITINTPPTTMTAFLTTTITNLPATAAVLEVRGVLNAGSGGNTNAVDVASISTF